MTSATGSSSYAAATSPAALPEPYARSLLSASLSSYSFDSAASSSSSTATAASRHSSHISKTYRQASTLFLTRRLPEALTTLAPLVTPSDSADSREPAPVARASRTTRVKVWSLYLTVLNAILEMEPDEGKEAFGNQEWRGLCAKVRDGHVWEEVVRHGYHGVESDVDSDVVINLATLLLAHARDQTLNQRRLETYLASSNAPNLDMASKLAASPPPATRVSHRYRSPAPGASGTDTPRDLNARVKILELYTLHVLLRNNEWDYAREFISVSSVLDDERREAFLQALQSLQEDQQEQERLDREERQRQEDQLRQDIEDARRQRAEYEEMERRRRDEERTRRSGSEVDYGIDQTPGAINGSSAGRRHQRPPRTAAGRPSSKAAVATTFTARAAVIMSRLRASLGGLATALNGNPALLTRLIFFIVGLLFTLGHRGIRQRMQRMLGASWGKLKATAGMGTKVSYI